jgi:uncharacterized protein (DUF305 family)
MRDARPTKRLGIAAIAAVSLLAALLVAAPASATGPRSTAESAFLVDMVGHHAMAVQMAEMAQEKATHSELKSLADEIVRSQTAEIRRMRSWLRRWYGRSIDPPDMGHHEDMRTLDDASGPVFEVSFMAMMGVHHAQAIERARAVRRRPIHGQVRALTRDIISAQTREIGQLREWLVAWYAN